MSSLVVNFGVLNTAPLNGSDAAILDQTWDVGIGSDSSAVIEFSDTEDIGDGLEIIGAALFYVSTSDVGIGSDAFAPADFISTSEDVGIGLDVESGFLSISTATSDTGVGTDSSGTLLVVSTTTDVGVGLDAAAFSDQSSTSDVGIGSDLSTSLSYALTEDVGIGADAALVYVVIASATVDIGIGSDLSAPFGGESGGGGQISVATISAYAVNTDTGAVSAYALPVEVSSLMAVGGALYVATEAGLYAMDAKTDNGAGIVWSLQTGMTNFGDPHLKRIEDADILARTDGDVLLKVITDRAGTKRVDAFRKPPLTAEAHRDGVTKIGKGLNSVYWGIGLEGQGFADIDAVVLSPVALSRRR